MTVSGNEHEIMRNPKVYIIGGDSSEYMSKALLLLKEKNIDVVTVEEDADASVSIDWILGERPKMVLPDMDFAALEEKLVVRPEIELFCGHPLANVGAKIPNCTSAGRYGNKQHWRGGKPGRKGKIKYERR